MKKNTNKNGYLIIFLFLTLLFLIYSCNSKNINNDTSNLTNNKKIFFSVYMVGSDLEDDIKPRNEESDEKDLGKKSNIGAGTNDLKEIISGYDNLTPDEKKNIDIVIAFGGARKEGWQGIKYADINCLKKDAEDGYFGNDNCYVSSNKTANMGAEKTLQEYFEFINKSTNDSYKKIAVLWDHGVDYSGIGLDKNNEDLLTLPEINKSLENSKLKLDLIGFDACLMGSLEVAKAVNNYANYMVASEEQEPGHGWNYEDIVTFMGKNSKSDITAIGKKIVDIFIDSENHKKSNNKTLALLDLKETDNIIKKLDQLFINYNDSYFSSTLDSITKSESFGINPKAKLITSIDLKSFIKNLQKNNKNLSNETTQLLNSLDKFILYNKHDRSKPDANGISIYSLNKDLKKVYNTDNTISTNFLNFTDKFINYGKNDNTKPIIKASDFSTKNLSIKENKDDCEYENKKGHCLKIYDDLGLEIVEQLFAVKQNNEKIMLLGSRELDSIDDRNNYFFESWNGKWFTMCDGNCSGNNNIQPSAYFDEFTEDDTAIFSSDAQITYDNETPFDVVVYYEAKLNTKGQPTNIIDEWIVPYDKDKDGNDILSKEQYDFDDLLEDGDFTIEFYYKVTDKNMTSEEWELSDKLKIHTSPKWGNIDLEGDLVYFVSAEDYKGNLSFSDTYKANDIKN